MSMSSSSSSSFPRRTRPQHEYDTTMGTIMDDDRYSEPSSSARRRPLPRFLGPNRRDDNNYMYRTSYLTQQQQPLVLDPSRQQQTTPLSVASSEGGASNGFHHNEGIVKKLLAATTIARRDNITENALPRGQQQHDVVDPSLSAASYFARSSPRAGFLLKLGTNVVEFKRRFFVLNPTTHLYYFLSPNDVEPRGCIDLKNAKVHDLGGLRFELALPDKNFVVLEARSEQVKEQWIKSLNTERLEHVKEELNRAHRNVAEQKEQVAQLEQDLEQYRHVEHDRDMALEDAAAWKSQYENLEKAVRLLTRHIRRAPSETYPAKIKEKEITHETSEKEDIVENQSGDNIEQNVSGNSGLQSNETEKMSNVVEKPKEGSTPASPPSSEDSISNDKSSLNKSNASHRETSLLDSVSHDLDEGAMDEQLHDMANDLDSRSFSSLLNVCLQLMENMNLASVEAATAVEDLHEAQDNVSKIQKRMTKAERHLCRLWEENCELRKSLKNCKKEKKVLVREVKSLMTEAAEQATKVPQDEQMALEHERERLIDELEEHVMTSIHLHEQLLSGGGNQKVKLLTAGENGSSASSSANSRAASMAVVPYNERAMDQPPAAIDRYAAISEREDSARRSTTDDVAGLLSSGQVISSLMDTDSETESESDPDENDHDEDSMAPSLVSLVAGDQLDEGGEKEEAKEQHDADRDGVSGAKGESANVNINTDGEHSLKQLKEKDSDSQQNKAGALNLSNSLASQQSSDDDSEEAKENPLLQLNDIEDDDSQSLSQAAMPGKAKPTITDNGKATSRLISPLADVVATQQGAINGVGNDGRVYHLSFYTRKIGIQFQKVPLSKTSNGLLTEAMTADYGDAVVDQKGKTASELRRIAAISRLAKDEKKGEDTCPVATPVDAVLVCGLKGFDGSQTPPKLGARLVAFDGVSVEVGRWTFDSVRKAIQARGRPLTLSFRNDMLTTKQRAILTKAVADVNSAATPSARLPPVHHPSSRRGSGTVSSMQSSDSEGRLPVVSIDSRTPHSSNDDYDDHSVSTMASVSIASDPTSNGAPRTSPYSFSEAGSSSVVSSAFGPLMANLMSGLSHGEKPESGSTPSYLRREVAESLENVAHHRQFKDSLL